MAVVETVVLVLSYYPTVVNSDKRGSIAWRLTVLYETFRLAFTMSSCGISISRSLHKRLFTVIQPVIPFVRCVVVLEGRLRQNPLDYT
jgi:hypothetical protein